MVVLDNLMSGRKEHLFERIKLIEADIIDFALVQEILAEENPRSLFSLHRTNQSTKMRKRLIQNGMKTAKEWSWARSIDLLEKVIAGKKPERYYANTNPEVYNHKGGIRRLANIRKSFRR